jgi:hypothetical protein
VNRGKVIVGRGDEALEVEFEKASKAWFPRRMRQRWPTAISDRRRRQALAQSQANGAAA